MSFASPLWLFLLTLVPLIVLLHGIAVRWRSTPISSLLFWNEVIREKRTSMRIRRLLRSLVLLLEVLAAACLACALAGPQMKVRGFSGTGDTIIVLDSTASMKTREGARTRFDLARDRALDVIQGMGKMPPGAAGGAARAALIMAGRSPRLVLPFTSDRAALRRAIQTSTATDEPGDITESMLFAIALRDARRGDQVVLVTDGAFDSLGSIDISAPWLHILTVGTPRDNVGITGLSFRRTLGGEETYEMFLAVRNTGRKPVTVALTVTVEHTPAFSRLLSIDAGQETTITIPWTGPISGRVEARLQSGDDFPLDDRAYAVFTPARSARVLVVGRGSYFLEKALESLPGVIVRTAAQPEGLTAAGAGTGGGLTDKNRTPADDLVIYDGVEPPPLEHGNFICFAAVPPNLPVRVTGRLELPAVTGWSRTDPLLDSVPLGGVAISEALRLVPGPGFSLLAESRDSPLILSWDHAGLKALLVAFDPAGSDLPLRPGFIVMLANALSWCIPSWLTVHADQVQAGSPVALAVYGDGPVSVEMPDGTRQTVAASGSSTEFFGTSQVGFYRVEGSGREFAVSLVSAPESDITPRFTQGAAAAGSAEAGGGGSVQRAAWRALAIAALALILGEWLIWFRASRRQGARLSKTRGRIFLVLRLGAVLLVVLALGGIGFIRRTDHLSVIFLLDQSQSVNADQRAFAAKVIERVRARLGRGDSASLVRFAGTAELDTLVPGVPVAPEAVDDVEGNATNISGAIQFGLAQAARATTARIVLLSDGNENRGSAAEAAAVARSLGARVFPVPIPTLPAGGAAASKGEVSVEDIRAPVRVRQGEPHEVTVMMKSRFETRGRITLLRDGLPIATRDVLLAPGENAVQFTGVLPERGLHAWDALVTTSSDGVAQNNHFRRFVEVTGAPQALYVSKPGRESQALLAALAAQGITTVVRGVSGLPGTLTGYLPYDALILDDVPGYGISNEKMETIARYVRDAAGGLLMIGGANSFGAGGYYKTPIERVLPVDMDVKSQVQLPRLSLVIVVDKSGSMGGAVASGETKLDVVKSAAISSIELLNPFDRVGLLAFDADLKWAVPLTAASDTQTIAAGLAALQPGGGTIMYPALEEACRAISASPSPLRHIIILSDGLTNPGDFEKLVRAMAKQKITVSTVAVGEDADRGLLENIARWGGGRAYATNDPRDVPRIFVTETTLVTRGLLVEKSFLPRLVSTGESLRGIALGGMPAVGGFVLTSMKPGAEMVLSALYDSPLLAAWRYGLGRTAAFTSDFRGRWAKSWLSWDQFPRFAAQLVRWIERPSGGDVLHPRIEVARGKASITVDAYDTLGAFINGLEIKGIVIGPGGERTEISVPQTGPGLYEGGFDAGRVGDYTATLSARSPDASVVLLTTGTSVSYSDEFRMLGVNMGLLELLAADTGGRVVSGAEDDAAISEILRREPGRASAGSGSAWRVLLLAAIVLFFLDIAVRRMAVPDGLLKGVAAWAASFRREPGLSYDQLTGLVAKAREEEKTKLRSRISSMGREGRIDPELAAYLYIARLRSRKAEEGKKE